MSISIDVIRRCLILEGVPQHFCKKSHRLGKEVYNGVWGFVF